MAKLRKMLGRVDDPSVVAMMSVIETQSVQTLAAWATDYTEVHILPVYEKACPENTGFQEVLAGVRAYLRGDRPLREVKPLLKRAAQMARETEGETAQAAARAISTACAVIQTPTGALGFTFYAAAAIIYERVGLEEKPAVYDTLAAEEMAKMLASLQEAAVPDEENPAKINWHC